ncbi:MAG: hypothetical protein K1Y36_22335 [Blastocatellia bacterium]|nr:hypothetical protein [Blastocatellia bacterium]
MLHRYIKCCILMLFLGGWAAAFSSPQDFGDRPQARHVSQEDIEAGKIPVPELLKAGEKLFSTEFNRLDGLNPRNGNFNRIIGPDTQSCADCHFRPFVGAAGPNIANVFAAPLDDTRLDTSNPRNTNHMFGSGAVESLGIEMTQELLALERQAKAEAKTSGKDVTVALTTKGVNFGSLTAHADGSTDKVKVVGVDLNLVIKPFSRKGIVRTIRQFSINANNLHFGMQAVELIGDFIDGDDDGVVNELTVGDITAETAWQALLPTPVQVMPADPKQAELVRRGEALFAQAACTTCHIPTLTLKRPVFRLPNPRVNTGKELTLDLTTQAKEPRLARNADGTATVALYADLKRHEMGPELAEANVQTGVAPSVFITVPLWGVGSTAPWLHDGRATTLHDAIVLHGGEAELSRKAYQAFSDRDQRAVVEFLKSLQLVQK